MAETAVLAPGWPAHVGGEWTVDLLEGSPDDGLRYEILDGTLIVSAAPRPQHQRALLRLALLLTAACPADHEVFIAPLDWQPDQRTSLEPDLLVVAKDRIGEMNITQAPALVMEVASPSSARIDRHVKYSRYAEGGIAQYWIVDPRVPSVEVFDLVDGEYQLTARSSGTDAVRIVEPFAVTVVPLDLVSD